MTYMIEFYETTTFTQWVNTYLMDDEYAAFQAWLAVQPDAGQLIPGSGGLRKVRWKTKGKGKRGGVRIIYYWRLGKRQIYLLTIFSKHEVADLTRKQLAYLKRMIEEGN